MFIGALTNSLPLNCLDLRHIFDCETETTLLKYFQYDLSLSLTYAHTHTNTHTHTLSRSLPLSLLPFSTTNISAGPSNKDPILSL